MTKFGANVIVSGKDEIRNEIRKQASSGVDNIKLQITRSTVQKATGGSSVTFTKEEMTTAVEAAHDAGLSIAAHAEGPEGVIAAVEAGFDTVHHASFIDDRTVDALENHPETRVAFTVGVYDPIIHNGPDIGYPNDSIKRVIETWPAMVAAVQVAARRGLPFGLGSDAGGRVHPQGHFSHEAVIMVRDCGLTVEAAIEAATLRLPKPHG